MKLQFKCKIRVYKLFFIYGYFCRYDSRFWEIELTSFHVCVRSIVGFRPKRLLTCRRFRNALGVESFFREQEYKTGQPSGPKRRLCKLCLDNVDCKMNVRYQRCVSNKCNTVGSEGNFPVRFWVFTVVRTSSHWRKSSRWGRWDTFSLRK